MAIKLNRTVKIAAGVAAVALVAAMVILLPSVIRLPRTIVSQTVCVTHNKPLWLIADQSVYFQEFLAQEDYLEGVDILLATRMRQNSSNNHLLIMDSLYRVLADVPFGSADVEDNSYRQIIFDRSLYTGKGSRVRLGIYSDDGTLENSLSVWADTTNTVYQLYRSELVNGDVVQAARNPGTRIPGSLVFRTYESDIHLYRRLMLFFALLAVIGFMVVILAVRSGKTGIGARKTDVAVSLIFILFIFAPGIYFYAIKPRDLGYSVREKRLLAPRPELSAGKLAGFPAAFDNYFNDHFTAREKLTRLRSIFYYDHLHKSMFPDKVRRGREDWLYLPGERGNVEGRSRLVQAQLDMIVNVLHERQRYYHEKGIAFYIALVPQKSDIYREYLPEYYQVSDGKLMTDDIIDALRKDTTLTVIDCKPVLLDAKKSQKVFFKTDFHWSEAGAFLGYAQIMERISRDFPTVKPLTFNDFVMNPKGNLSGNDAIQIGLENHVTEPFFDFILHHPKSRPVDKVGYPPTPGFSMPHEFEYVRMVNDTTLPSIVVIRDSFFHLLVPLFGENFRRSVFIWDGWSYGANKEVIEQEKPDIVLLQIYQGFVLNVLREVLQ